MAIADGFDSCDLLFKACNYTYDSFGNAIAQTGGTENNYLFAGEQYDAGLGDYYLRARYYDPQVGRFTGRDTYEGYRSLPQTLHDYGYVQGNPVNLVDPSGLTPLSEFVIKYANNILKNFRPDYPIWRRWAFFGSEAHKVIQKDIQMKYPHVFVEYPIPGGSIDVLDESRGKLEVYEIKPRGGQEGGSQLKRYTAALPDAVRGTFPFAGLISNPSEIALGISIEYNLDKPGLIVYSPFLNSTGQAILTTVSLILLARGLSSCYAVTGAGALAGQLASTASLTRGFA